MKGLTRAATAPRGCARGGRSSKLSVLRRRLRLEQEEEPEGSLEAGLGAGLSIMGGALEGERAEQEEAERGLLTGQSSMRTHTSSERSRPRSVDSLFFLRHVPLERCDVTSSSPRPRSLAPLSLDSEEAESTEEELPVRFHVPTRGRDVECCLALTPLLLALLFSRFHVPVRLKRDDVTSCGREGLSECERLASVLRLGGGCWFSGLDSESSVALLWF